jgi:hypothetical protein
LSSYFLFLFFLLLYLFSFYRLTPFRISSFTIPRPRDLRISRADMSYYATPSISLVRHASPPSPRAQEQIPDDQAPSRRVVGPASPYKFAGLSLALESLIFFFFLSFLGLGKGSTPPQLAAGLFYGRASTYGRVDDIRLRKTPCFPRAAMEAALRPIPHKQPRPCLPHEAASFLPRRLSLGCGCGQIRTTVEVTIFAYDMLLPPRDLKFLMVEFYNFVWGTFAVFNLHLDPPPPLFVVGWYVLRDTLLILSSRRPLLVGCCGSLGHIALLGPHRGPFNSRLL